MARQVANVDVITDSFEIWLLETNELLHALSTEIITANSTYANTGNSTFSRTAQLYGTFGANNLVVSNWMKGGNVNGQFANLMIRPMGRQTGITERGNQFVLTQWAPSSIQLTLQNGNYVISETLENIRSEQEMLGRRNTLEDEFISWVNSKLQSVENTNEAIN